MSEIDTDHLFMFSFFACFHSYFFLPSLSVLFLLYVSSKTALGWLTRKCRGNVKFTKRMLLFSHSVTSDSLRPHGLQYASLPCPSPAPRACSKLMSIESMMPSNHLILCHHHLLLPLIFPSIRVFSKDSVLHIRWPKYWCFSISPSNEYSGFISFRVDWFDFLSVQGTLKSLLQHHSS